MTHNRRAAKRYTLSPLKVILKEFKWFIQFALDYRRDGHIEYYSHAQFQLQYCKSLLMAFLLSTRLGGNDSQTLRRGKNEIENIYAYAVAFS